MNGLTNKEMHKAIVAANKRLQRMRVAGLTEGQGYKLAMAAVARTRGETYFNMKHITISESKKQSQEELENNYFTAQYVLKEEETRVGYIRREVKKAEKEIADGISEQKRKETFMRRFKFLPTDTVYDILKGKQFQQLSEVFGDSDQIVKAMKEAVSSGVKTSTIKRRITSLIKFWQDKEVYFRYEEVLQDLLSATDGKFDNKVKDVLK